MKRILPILFLFLIASAHGQVMRGLKANGIAIDTANPAPTPPVSVTGITFSPAAGAYTGTQSLSILGAPTSNMDIFYTQDGSPVTEASLQYASPFNISQNLTVNALSVTAPTSLGQVVQSSWAGWKTQLSCTADLCGPYVGYYSTPNVAYCGTMVAGTLTAAMTSSQTTAPLSVSVTSGTLLLIGSEYMKVTSTGTNPTVARGVDSSTAASHTSGTSFKDQPNVPACGVSGVPTQAAMTTGVANPSLSGNAAHMSFQTSGIVGAGDSQTQILWGQHGVAADDATYQAEDFYMLPDSNFLGVYALEEDLALWIRTRNLILSGALQCVLGSNTWEYSGQTGGWQPFGYNRQSVAMVVYKNGVAIGPAGTHITEGCSHTNGGSIPGPLDGSATVFNTSAVVSAGQIIHIDNENILIKAASGTSVTDSVRGYRSTAASHSAGTTYLTWIHVQYHVTFNPNVVDGSCADATTGASTECVYIDYLSINGNKYTFGTSTATDANGNIITVSKLRVPAAPLPAGYPSRCNMQIQIDTQTSGATLTSPKTVGMYYDDMGMVCGSGTPNSTGSATFTF